MNIDEILNGIKGFYHTNRTKDVQFRIEQLVILKNAIIKYESEFLKALYEDLHKSPFEVYTTEIGIVIKEINYIIKNLKKWAKTEKVQTPFFLAPAKSMIIKEPYGSVLIIVPFNYPVQLSLLPLAGAIAAGNCAVIRTSKKTPQTSKVINKMIGEIYNPNFVRHILPEEISSVDILKGGFDYIFFTGSPEAGIEVAKAAAEKLIPYTLELGGKSPVIVDKTADIDLAARRIAWGKFLNAGQTCIAPDYVLAHYEIKKQLIDAIVKAIRKFYGVIVQESPDYGRIVDTEAFYRLKEIIDSESQKIVHGGQTDECGLYIEPTIIDEDYFDSPAMQKEIFGPILPVLSWSDSDDIFNNIRTKHKPLALYVFSKNKAFRKDIIRSLSFGGGAVNDTINQVTNFNLPFGGVGFSGMGNYHGKYSFDTFTHLKSVLVRKNNRLADNIFPPYDEMKISLVRKFFK